MKPFGTTILILMTALGLSACGRFVQVGPTAEPLPPTATIKVSPLSSGDSWMDQIYDQEPSDDYSKNPTDAGDSTDHIKPLDLTPKGPIKDQVVSEGSSQKGRLEAPSNLLLRQLSYGNKSPFQIVYPARETFFGSAELIDAIVYLAQALKVLVPNTQLKIGDLSRMTGGKLGAHASHQTGIDADIAYLESAENQSITFKSLIGSTIAKTVLVKEQFELFRVAVRKHFVQQIFIHPRLKQEFCSMAQAAGTLSDPLTVETLRRLTPDKNHDTHFHLRLKCPRSQPRCIPEAEPAFVTGC